MVLNCLINNTANAKSDDYATPAHVWKDIEEFIPKNGCTDVLHKNVDFFTNTLLYSVVIDNPPFSKKKQILSKLRHDCTPFILLVPPSTLCTQYFRNLFNNDKDIQFIIPRTRIHFISGTENDNRPSNCPFDTIYLCWRMNLPREINWID